MIYFIMIDTHCHIHYYENYHDIINNSIDNGVNRLLNLFEISSEEHIKHIKNTNSKKDIFNINNNKIDIFGSIGVHPLSVDNIDLYKASNIIEDNINKIIAIGETGLDLFKANNKTKQLEYFEMHCSLCKKHNKPIIIHARACDIIDLIDITKRYNIKVIFHCWTFGPKELNIVLNYDYTVSFSGIITFDKSGLIKDSADICPLSNLFIETDSPFLCPTPFRSKSNEPMYIKYIYEYIAKLKNLPINELTNAINNNFNNIFNL